MGGSQKEIARESGISENTVHSHVTAIYKRLGVTAKGELLAILISRIAHAAHNPTLWPSSVRATAKKYPVELTDEQRKWLAGIIRDSNQPARRVVHA